MGTRPAVPCPGLRANWKLRLAPSDLTTSCEGTASTTCDSYLSFRAFRPAEAHVKNHARRPRLFNGLAWFFEPVISTCETGITLVERMFDTL